MNTIYFSARRGYLGPAATLPEFHGKGLDSIGLYAEEMNEAAINLLDRLRSRICIVGSFW